MSPTAVAMRSTAAFERPCSETVLPGLDRVVMIGSEMTLARGCFRQQLTHELQQPLLACSCSSRAYLSVPFAQDVELSMRL